MPEAEVKEIELGAAPTMAEYNKARDEGKSVIEMPVAEPVEEETKAETTEETKVEDEKPKQKGWNGAQKKIDRLVREKAEAEERASRAEARTKELEGKSAKVEPTKVVDDPNLKPIQENFTTLEEYVEALTEWKMDRKLRTQAEAEEIESEEDRVRGIVQSYKEKLVAAKTKYEDYDDVVSESVKSPWPEKNPTKMDLAAADAFRTAVIEDDNSAEIAYYYGKHPDEFLALGGKTPAQVVKAVARLSDKLTPTTDEKEETEEVEGKPAPKIVSKSAPPIKPVNSGNTRSTVPMDRMQTMREYNAAREAGRQR